ncbi:carbohydrate ABC transporter permease [Alicyclobacillus fodiniaquatilis]|uniref:Carbohydrate ABC transporter permease n=1 Tax=Alicyclobacillus fodiniaquatilis TaxID=1661150 RepID=A0ABW4JKE3_9BACL
MTAKRPSVMLNTVLVILVILSIFPIFFMISNAFKDGVQTAANPFSIQFAKPFGSNFLLAWQVLSPAFFRTVVIVLISVLGIVALAMLSAYSFGRLDFPGKKMLFNIVFGLLLIPGFLTLIPLFLEIKNLGLLNSKWGLILPYIAGNQAFAIFVFRTFIQSLPGELFEAAYIDGASDIQIFTKVVIPLSVPIMVTIALLNINGLWGDYVLPSLILDPNHSTVAVTIANFQPPQDAPNINAGNMQDAAFTVSSIPIAALFLFLMRYFVSGITNGAIKM